MKKPRLKTALEKAKSGLLLINSDDISKLASENVNFLPRAPMAKAACNGADALDKEFFRAPTRLSQEFDKRQRHPHCGDDFTLWMMAIMATQHINRHKPPVLDYC